MRPPQHPEEIARARAWRGVAQWLSALFIGLGAWAAFSAATAVQSLAFAALAFVCVIAAKLWD